MPGQRAPGQKQVLTMFDEQFLSEIAAAMRMAGYSDRSRFIRDAVYEKLQRMGIKCDYQMAMAPARHGKVTVKNRGNNNTTSINSFSYASTEEGRAGGGNSLNEEAPKYGAKKKKPKK